MSGGTSQRIARLAPLSDILSRLDALAMPVSARDLDPLSAAGATLAADIAAPADFPPAPIAVRDGWAVASELVLDAGPYAPVLLAGKPQTVSTGEPMPAGTDAVLPPDAVHVGASGAEAHAPAAAGEGVMAAGAGAAKGTTLCAKGTRVRASDAAVLRSIGVASLPVRRPRLRIVPVSVPASGAADTVSPLIARIAQGEGADTEIAEAGTLEDALRGEGCDALVTVGGTGMGPHDAAVAALRRMGTLALHGFALSPGESGALGAVQGRPVLMLPGRLDAALACFLVAGSAMLRRLAGRTEREHAQSVRLTKKVASTVGLAQVVLLRQTADGAEPLGTDIFPLQSIARAGGWTMVPAESEGVAAGAFVEMRPLP